MADVGGSQYFAVFRCHLYRIFQKLSEKFPYGIHSVRDLEDILVDETKDIMCVAPMQLVKVSVSFRIRCQYLKLSCCHLIHLWGKLVF